MSRFWLIPIVFFLFLLEGTLFQWMIPGDLSGLMLSPHLVLLVIVYMSMFLDLRTATIFGIIFGLLHDFTFYGFMMGPYAFGMALAAYFAGLLFHQSKWTVFSATIAMLISLLLFEHLIFGIYSLFQVVELAYQWTLLHVILPNTLFNLIISLLIYFPMKIIIEKMKSRPDQEEEL